MKEPKRTGGTHKTLVRQFRLAMVMTLLTILFIVLARNLLKISTKIKNYQEVHQRLANIESFIKNVCKDVPAELCNPASLEKCSCEEK